MNVLKHRMGSPELRNCEADFASTMRHVRCHQPAATNAPTSKNPTRKQWNFSPAANEPLQHGPPENTDNIE